MSETLQAIDQQVRFEDRMVRIYNDAAIALMISVGHRTGLFDVMSQMKPATSAEIAKAASLNERYVRELLNALTVGSIIEYDDANAKYSLPESHARWLTRKTKTDNLAVIAQFVSVMADVEEEIVECFHKGGGVPYTRFKRFHEVMAEESGQTVVPVVVDLVLPLADGVVDRLRSGIDVLDLGCGRGLAIMKMAEAFPNSRFVGYDLSDEAILFAIEAAKKTGLPNLKFAAKDVSKLEDSETFDLITAFDAIHDQAQPLAVLKNINRALRNDGTFIMQDIDASTDVGKNREHPLGPFLYAISCMHCMTVSLALDGEGLGTMWGREKALEYLQKSGFESVNIHKLEHDIQNCIYVARKHSP